MTKRIESYHDAVTIAAEKAGYRIVGFAVESDPYNPIYCWLLEKQGKYGLFWEHAGTCSYCDTLCKYHDDFYESSNKELINEVFVDAFVSQINRLHCYTGYQLLNNQEFEFSRSEENIRREIIPILQKDLGCYEEPKKWCKNHQQGGL